ncbi:hypothetical protein K439DRAFT_716973 [Ramaria rubella]|nr:hypothetical protein K439DRAFT_716973 [Ramaria rubella]
MTDANVVMSDALSSSARDMSEDLPSPSPQQCRLSLGPRRTSSAPNLRSFSNLGSSVSSDEPPSSGSSSSSRTSYSHREWRPHEFRLPRPAPADNDRAQSPGSPRSPIEPAVPASSTEATAERITENMELMTRRLEEIRRNLSRRQRRSSRLTWRNAYIAAAGFFGYGPEGTASRKEIVSLTGKLLFGAGQVSFR